MRRQLIMMMMFNRMNRFEKKDKSIEMLEYELVLTALVYLAGRREKKQDDSTFEYRHAYMH